MMEIAETPIFTALLAEFALRGEVEQPEEPAVPEAAQAAGEDAEDH